MTVTHLEQLLYSAALPLLLTAGGTFALIKWGEAKFWHALLFLVGGFYLAKSPVAPYIETFLGRIPGLFGWHPHLPAVHLTTPQSALALAAWVKAGPA
jgi:hypothetical protein